MRKSGLALLLGLALCAAYRFTSCGDHDRRLRALEARFAAVSHPPGTEALAGRARLGVLSGNGNHCDYFVGQVRRSTLPRQQVQAAYADPIRVFFFDAGVIPDGWEVGFDEGTSLAAWGVEPGGGDVYLVSLLDPSTRPGGDWRCH